MFSMFHSVYLLILYGENLAERCVFVISDNYCKTYMLLKFDPVIVSLIFVNSCGDRKGVETNEDQRVLE